MINYTKQFFVAIIIGLISWGCSAESDKKTAYLSAQFSTADSAVSSQKLSGIEFTIIQKDSANAEPDTLFNASTDSTGSFAGTATFEEKRQYSSIISRNGQDAGSVGVFLADGDSIRIEGSFPNLEESLSISSREHDAMKDYERINRNFERIRKFANAGVLEGDSLRDEIKKWSDIYWEIRENNKGTIASELATRDAIRLLQGTDNEKMMKRLRSVQKNDKFSNIGAQIGKTYMANSQGLGPALAYLDTLRNITENEDNVMQINMERVKLLYDSARVNEAKEELKAFKEKYPKKERPQDWVESMNYDLNYMSPGDTIPKFQFTENDVTVSRDSLLGTPYILEVTRLSNKLYQQQFNRTVAIHSIYKNYDLQVVTLPLDDSQITVDAFFNERMKPWPVADAQTFDRQQLIDEFNVRLIPTRFLIDRDGKIIRKYVGEEYEDVIKGIQTLVKKEKEPAS